MRFLTSSPAVFRSVWRWLSRWPGFLSKRVPPPETRFLDRDTITQLFAQLPKNGRFALRDRAILLFLYNTAARVQEVADLHVADIQFGEKPSVRLHGKGDKWRACPLWKLTSELL